MENNVFLNQQIEGIRRYGYVEFSNPDFAIEVMAELPRPEFAEVKHVAGAGRFAVEGFIYLPRAKKKLAARVKRDLREAESNAAIYRRTIAVLET